MGDIDEDTELEMISALRIMQNNGLIDSISENQLDLVDQVIAYRELSIILIVHEFLKVILCITTSPRLSLMPKAVFEFAKRRCFS